MVNNNSIFVENYEIKRIIVNFVYNRLNYYGKNKKIWRDKSITGF